MSKRISTKFMAKYVLFEQIKQPKIASFIPQKITIPNPDHFYSKLNNIRNHSKQLEFISDFDYTITKFQHQLKQCDSLFGMWSKAKFLPQNFTHDLIQSYQEFGPYETDSTISFQERVHLMGQLYKFQFKAFQKYEITKKMAETVFNSSQIVFRAYTKQFLQTLQQFNIPLYIISGGISDSIFNSILSLSNGIKQFRNISIHSNQFEIYQNHKKQYQNNKFIKFKKNIIHSYNKFQVMNHVNKRKNCFLMGDLVSDIYMAQGNNYQNILSIFYAKDGENDQRALAEKKFDIIVQGDSSHKIIIELVKVINQRTDIDWEYLYSTRSNIHELII